ncbi:MAG: hypothetical protein AB7O59_02515 [Pirellulales bacterium]
MLTLLLWTALLAAAAEEAKPAAPTADQVARLVRDLDARELTVRNEAERALLELGEAVLPLLPRVGDDTPAEISLRVSRVQQKLLEAQAAAAAEPTVVTLQRDDAPISEVFAEIQKQTGNTIVDNRGAFNETTTDVHVKVDFDKTPFWKALDQTLDQAGMALYQYSGERGAYVVSRPPGAGPAAEHAHYSGIFRIEPLRFEAVRDLRNRDTQSLRFYLEVTWEPRLQPFAILQPLGEISAVGDNGENIAVTSEDAMPEATIRSGMSATELEIQLALPPRDTKSLRTLKGKFLALVPGPAEDFRFSKPPIAARNAPPRRLEQRKAGATVAIDRLRKNNSAWEVSLRVKFDSPSTALESHRGWILDNDVYFIDPAGRRFAAGGFEQSRQAKDEVGINYFFDLEQSPDTLDFVYRTPITILEIPIEYELRDLPLP